MIRREDECLACKALKDALSEETKKSHVEQSRLISILLNGHLEACHSKNKRRGRGRFFNSPTPVKSYVLKKDQNRTVG